MMYSDEQIEAYRDHLTRCLPSGIFVHPTWAILHSQHATRPRTEAQDATRTQQQVDTEAGHETTGIHTDNNNNKRETTTHKTNKGNKRE